MRSVRCSAAAFGAILMAAGWGLGQEKPELPGGELQILGDNGVVAGACPLKHTDVTADIAGFVARVTVKQTFHNPLSRKIEAVYVFPLPQDAAVDDMTMLVGDRRIVGQIKPREEAREVYEAAKAAGHVASLLDQERPNIFTQSVANIEPGVQVVIEISYVETLKYADGVFEWVFPMVVGPRYIPGEATSKIPDVPPEQKGQVVELDKTKVVAGPAQPKGTGWAPDTDQVPDASRVTPHVVKPGMRAGHDISLTLTIDAGMQIFDVKSELHEIDAVAVRPGVDSPIHVTLKNQAEIPNKDFILHYRLATDQIGDALLVHEDQRGRFFTLILQPPQRVVPSQVVPRELIFVLDTSGSMHGFPIDKAKEVMNRLIDTMQTVDTFNVITFSGDTRILWPQPKAATKDNIRAAQQFLAAHEGGGGTEMMKAINAALVKTATRGSSQAVRIVCFMTDGYVGNDMAIIDAVKQNAGTTRVFSFGIGNSVNRFLLDGMAQAGRGEVEYVSLNGDAEAAMKRFHERILAPVLTDIQIDWGSLPVADVYPQQIPDLFSAKPIMVHGRLTAAAGGTITLHGVTGAGPVQNKIEVPWPAQPPSHPAVASLWARAKIADLMMQDFAGLQAGSFPADLKQQITELGLTYRLMTQFTSFVAVEEMTVTVGGQPTKIEVPVEMPDGVSYEGVFGEQAGGQVQQMRFKCATAVPVGGAGSGMFGQGQGAPAGPHGWAAKKAEARQGERLYTVNHDAIADKSETPRSPEEIMRSKLAEPLRDLAAKVAKDGKDGNLAAGKIVVTNYRVDVIVLLEDTSEKTLAALQALGFEQVGESKAVSLLIGSIDVRKLEELAKLEAVIRIRPVAQ
jgi:Ca-activated chloride channel family protein